MLIAAQKAWKDLSIYIILFDNHFPFQKPFCFCYSKSILGIVLDKCVQTFGKIFSAKKCIFALECYIHFYLSISLFGK